MVRLDFKGRRMQRWHTIIHHQSSGWYLIVVFFRFRDLSARRLSVRSFFTRSGRTAACFPAGCRRPKYRKQFFPRPTTYYVVPVPVENVHPLRNKVHGIWTRSLFALEITIVRRLSTQYVRTRATVGRCNFFPTSKPILVDRSMAFILFGCTLRFKR